MFQHIANLEWADLMDIAHIESRLFEKPTDLQKLRMLFEKKAFRGFGLSADWNGASAIAAYAIFLSAGQSADLVTIGTKTALQRKGFAHAVLNHGMTTLASEGVQELFLEVAEDNIAAISLYVALGFKAATKRTGYYLSDHGPTDAVLMGCSLKAVP